MLKRLFVVAALMCGCGEASDSPTPAHPYPAEVRVGDGSLQDVVADGADAPNDVTSENMTDVAGDQPGDVAMNDGGDAGMDAPDAIDAPDVTDVSDAPAPVDVLDAPDASADTGVDVPADRGADIGPDVSDAPAPVDVLDAPDASADTGVDVPVDNGTDTGPTDTGPVDSGLCPSGQTRCPSGACVDLQTDSNNCGSCGAVCSIGAPVCSGGRCNSICGSGTTMCGPSTCANTMTDTANCGTCGTVCPTPANAVAACTSSVCGLGACNTGFENCNGSAGDGCEADLRTERLNCGACGRICTYANAAATCVARACTLGSCNAGFGNCDGNPANGCEVLLSSNINHCGACGNVCATYACASSVCTPVLAPNLELDVTDAAITGFQVRLVSQRDSNLVGVATTTLATPRLCQAGVTLPSGAMLACRLNWLVAVRPGSTTALVTTWADDLWKPEIIPLGAGGVPLCGTDPTCGGRWDGTSFRGVTVRCSSTGAPAPRLDYTTVYGSATTRAIIPFVVNTSGDPTALCGRL